MIITIDGPSGSGKTTLALRLAQELNFFCMNGGYLYRSMAYLLKVYYGYGAAQFARPNIVDVQSIIASGNLSYQYQSGLVKIYWSGSDITIFLKDSEISKSAAMIAQADHVRHEIRLFERLIIGSKDVIVEGRACGSVMYPQAEIKFYVDASVDLRAQRLIHDQLKRGKTVLFSEALYQIQTRDDMDKHRTVEPLVIPDGAVLLDSTSDTADEVFQKAIIIIQKYFQK